jgi:hypothetical protein
MKDTGSLSERSDREIQEALLDNQRKMIRRLTAISGWTAFFGWITIAGILWGIYAVLTGKL